MTKLALASMMLRLMGGSARAEFAKTLLEANGPVTVEVTGGATSTGETAVTVFFLAILNGEMAEKSMALAWKAAPSQAGCTAGGHPRSSRESSSTGRA